LRPPKNPKHPPRHNKTAVWPRAGFGLPIIVRFKGKGEPQGQFEIKFQKKNETYERLASPLIVKALPLKDGKFLPCALWMNRAYPQGGKVVLTQKNKIIENSDASFDELVAEGDRAFFRYLEYDTLQDAFFAWLEEKHNTVRIS